MQDRDMTEKRDMCRSSCASEHDTVRPVDIDVDFEGLAVAWKEVCDMTGKRG